MRFKSAVRWGTCATAWSKRGDRGDATRARLFSLLWTHRRCVCHEEKHCARRWRVHILLIDAKSGLGGKENDDPEAGRGAAKQKTRGRAGVAVRHAERLRRQSSSQQRPRAWRTTNDVASGRPALNTHSALGVAAWESVERESRATEKATTAPNALSGARHRRGGGAVTRHEAGRAAQGSHESGGRAVTPGHAPEHTSSPLSASRTSTHLVLLQGTVTAHVAVVGERW